MLQNVLVSRKAADAVAEFLVLALTMVFFVKFSFVLLVPLGLALFVIPLVLVTWLPASKSGIGFAAVVTLVASLTELWTYFLFQVVHKAHFGHPFSGLPL